MKPYTEEADARVAADRAARQNALGRKTAATLRDLAQCIETLAEAIEEDDHILGPMASTGVANHLTDLPRELRETFAECLSEEAVRAARADRLYLATEPAAEDAGEPPNRGGSSERS